MIYTGYRIGPLKPAGTAMRGSLEECLELLPDALDDAVTITVAHLGETKTTTATMQAIRKPDGEWGFTEWTTPEER